MEGLEVIKLMAMLSTLLVISVNGQINTPCTMSMISSFTPCVNFITGSTNNGSPPTASCCSSLKSLMSTGMDCACLLLTANVPLQLPINRTLAVSLPGACGVLGQCKSSGTPLPAPGPVSLGPALPPPAAAPLSPRDSKAVALAPAPESEITLPLTPASPPVQVASPPVQVEAPTTTAGIRPVLSPPASMSSHVSPPSSLLIFLAIMLFEKFY
ncbi:non-specific lipid transfer protein GPI-anchored 16 [Populus alba]|nr:non-specific lipid-transfer protein-like protein At2g13820 [Populus alba]KAJ7006199.1 non-specific lipid-transfer protein-like protein [Populus alba x Populus x berolinensis]